MVFLSFVSLAGVNTSATNLVTTKQAVKVASRLHLGMREKDVTTLLEREGLKCLLERAGDSLLWINHCDLAESRSLVLEFRKSPGRHWEEVSWEEGLLHAAYISARNGDRVLSIHLTSGP